MNADSVPKGEPWKIQAAVQQSFHPTVVWGIRHGQSVANVAFEQAAAQNTAETGLDGSDFEVPLTAFGERQAVKLGKWLSADPRRHPHVVYASPYLRTRQTASLALAQLGQQGTRIPVRLDSRLEDRHTGVLELLTPAAIAARFPEQAARLAHVGELDYRAPGGGESLWDVAKRVHAFWNYLQVATAGQRVLLVSHDATIVMLRAITEGLTEADVLRVIAEEPVLNAAISAWEPRDGTLRLTRYNDDDHLI